MSIRTRVFAVVALSCLAATAALTASGAAAPQATATRLGAAAGRSILVTDYDQAHLKTLGRMAIVPLGRRSTRRHVGDLRCERVYFASGRGICLAFGGGGFGQLYSAAIFNDRFEVTGRIGLDGPPTRTRVSPDGRYGAATVFVAGDSYSVEGSFSTRTLLIDMRRGKVFANLEQFTVTHKGNRIDAPDVNFWGVTFRRDRNRFYATMATGGKTYLIDGNVATRTARTLRENVECPSLSPDGTRIAYKKLVRVAENHARAWRLTVLDLRTMRDTAVAERASIDDQVEWLGDRLLYGKDKDVWMVPSDGTDAPVRLLVNASSPSVLG
jgi:hypothetical protein